MHDLIYSSTYHERTPSGPGKTVRSPTLQVAARHRDGWAGGRRQIQYTLQYYLLLSPPAIFLMNTRIVIIMYAIVVNLKLMQQNNRGTLGLQYANVCIQRRPRWLSGFASISYVSFAFAALSRQQALYMMCFARTAPHLYSLVQIKNRSVLQHRRLNIQNT